jgi:hypothetical protein
MCESARRAEWGPVGVAQWKGDLYALEACGQCGDYRAVLLDPDSIPIVEATDGRSPGSNPGGNVSKTTPQERGDGEFRTPDETTAVTDASADVETTESDADADDGDWLIE